MAKVGMRHRENFNEIVGNLSRDAVQLTHPNRMALLAMNNKIFSDGLENHLEAQQPTQNPTQQVYNPPPPQVAPYVPNVPQRAPIEASAAADGPPSWMQTGARFGLDALTGLAKTSVAAAKVIHASYQAQEAARQAARATAIRDDDFDFQSDGDDFRSIAGGSDSMAIEDAQQFHEMQMQNHARDIEEARARSQRDAIAMVEDTHQRNPFDDGGATLALMGRDTTASAVQLMQFAIEDTRPTFQHDGLDLITPSFPSSAWMEPPIPSSGLMELPVPTSLPPPGPFSFDSQAKRARVDGAAIVPYSRPAGPSSAGANRQLGVRTKMSKAVSKVTPSEPPPGADAGAGGTGRSKRNTSGVASTPAADRRRYKTIGQVPGRTPEEKLDYLLKQKASQPRTSQPAANGMLQLPPSDGTNPFANVFGGRSIGN